MVFFLYFFNQHLNPTGFFYDPSYYKENYMKG